MNIWTNYNRKQVNIKQFLMQILKQIMAQASLA